MPEAFPLGARGPPVIAGSAPQVLLQEGMGVVALATIRAVLRVRALLRGSAAGPATVGLDLDEATADARCLKLLQGRGRHRRGQLDDREVELDFDRPESLSRLRPPSLASAARPEKKITLKKRRGPLHAVDDGPTLDAVTGRARGRCRVSRRPVGAVPGAHRGYPRGHRRSGRSARGRAVMFLPRSQQQRTPHPCATTASAAERPFQPRARRWCSTLMADDCARKTGSFGGLAVFDSGPAVSFRRNVGGPPPPPPPETWWR